MQYHELLASEYLPAIFYFCLKKTGNVQDAEELSSDICYEILSSLKRTGVPSHFSAWVWKIARNRFSKWVKSRHTAFERTVNDEGYLERCPDETNVEQDIILFEQLRLLYRELSLIQREYREILVAHYLENQNVSMIAQRLSIPVGTVKTRLQRGRQKLKEGMNMTREFGVKSYQPEEIDFVFTAGFDKYNRIPSLIGRKIPKNILLETYRNSSTIEQLSLELGISSTYMEEEVEILQKGELLKCERGEYQTDFCIISRETQADIYERLYNDIEDITNEIISYIDARTAYLDKNHINWCYEYLLFDDLKWIMLLCAVDEMWEEALIRLDLMPDEQYPLHADGSDWILTGYEKYNGKQPPFVGLEGCVSEETGNYSKRVKFKKYELPFGKTSDMPMIGERLALALQSVVLGNISECNAADLQNLTEYGYIKDGKPVIPIFTLAYEQSDTDETVCSLKEAVLKKMCDFLKYRSSRIIDDSPAHLRNTPQVRNSLRGFVLRGAVLDEAVKNGYLNKDRSTPNLGVYMCI